MMLIIIRLRVGVEVDELGELGRSLPANQLSQVGQFGAADETKESPNEFTLSAKRAAAHHSGRPGRDGK